MFVGDEVELKVSFAVARERLMQLAGSGLLLSTSEDAYDLGTAGLARVGIPGLSKLVPVQDADVRLVRTGEKAAVLTMSGVYRPPLGALGQALDRAILHRVAAATIRGFIAQVAARIADQPEGYVTVPGGPPALKLNA